MEIRLLQWKRQKLGQIFLKVGIICTVFYFYPQIQKWNDVPGRIYKQAMEAKNEQDFPQAISVLSSLVRDHAWTSYGKKAKTDIPKIHQIAGQYYFDQAQQYEEKGEWDKAIESYEMGGTYDKADFALQKIQEVQRKKINFQVTRDLAQAQAACQNNDFLSALALLKTSERLHRGTHMEQEIRQAILKTEECAYEYYLKPIQNACQRQDFDLASRLLDENEKQYKETPLAKKFQELTLETHQKAYDYYLEQGKKLEKIKKWLEAIQAYRSAVTFASSEGKKKFWPEKLQFLSQTLNLVCKLRVEEQGEGFISLWVGVENIGTEVLSNVDVCLKVPAELNVVQSSHFYSPSPDSQNAFYCSFSKVLPKSFVEKTIGLAASKPGDFAIQADIINAQVSVKETVRLSWPEFAFQASKTRKK